MPVDFSVPRFRPSPSSAPSRERCGDVDALLDGLDRLIAKKRDLKQAAMQQLLTGQTRLPGFSRPGSEDGSGALASSPTAGYRGRTPNTEGARSYVPLRWVTCSGEAVDRARARGHWSTSPQADL